MGFITYDDLRHMRGRAQRRDQTKDDLRGRIGRINDAGQEEVWADQPRGRVWVTLYTGGAATSVKDFFCKVSPTFGSWVIVGVDLDGVKKVLTTDDSANVETFGTRAITLPSTLRDTSLRGDGNYDFVRKDRLDILRLKPTLPASLLLRYSGGLVAHDGAHYWIPAGVTASLSASVPGSGKRLVAIGLDMPSKALVYADGSIVAGSVPLDEAALAVIALTGSGTVFPLGGAILRAGQTSIPETDIITLQPFITTPAMTFTTLSDAPSSYTDEAGKYAVVNADEDAVEFAPARVTYIQTGDPGAVGLGTLWVDTTAGTGSWALKIRNAADDGWEAL
jgi:hypothetical protein